MSVVVAAIIGSAVVGGVTTYLVSDAQSDASRKASNAQERIADKNIALQKELADSQRQDIQPWRESGAKAHESIQKGITSGEFNANPMGEVDVTQDPGYKFRMEQGVNALDASASARGRLLSGAQQKALTNYSQGLASQEYGNAYARAADTYARDVNQKNTKFNMLSSLAGNGQVAATNQANVTGNLASAQGNILTNLGNSQAQNEINQGNIRAGAYQGYGQTINQAAENWLTYQGANA